MREMMENQTKGVIDQLLLDFSEQLHLLKLDEQEKCRIEQSRQAFLLKERLEENHF